MAGVYPTAGRSRTEYSSFQRPGPVRAWHHSSSVPTSVTCALSATGTTSPGWRSPSAGTSFSTGSSSISSASAGSTSAPDGSSLRVDDAKNRNVDGSPTTRPSSSSGSGAEVPSSMPNGATHSALTGGGKPGIAGIDDS